MYRLRVSTDSQPATQEIVHNSSLQVKARSITSFGLKYDRCLNQSFFLKV